jgi:ribosomal protein L20A (L18A)
MAQDGVTRARGFRQWGKEEEIRGWTERRKDKRAASDKSEQCEQSDCDEAIYADIGSPHQARRKVLQQPSQPQVRDKYTDVIEVSVLSARDH